MARYAGKDVLLKISDGASPPSFLTLGAARTTAFELGNDLAEVTPLGSAGAVTYSGEAGTRTARLALQGVFKDSAAEARLRAVALAALTCRYLLVFPNGDSYEADFIVESYRREGSYEGLEMFSAAFVRSGDGTWTSA